MSKTKHGNDASPADFLAGCCPGVGEFPVTVTYAVIGLTNFGERPVPSARLAAVLGRSVSEAEALARQWGWPGTRVEDGLITVNPKRARSATRRHVQVGDRRFGVTGCAGDIFYYAPLARPSLQVEETCPATGTPIRIVFTPSRVEHVEPAGAVVAALDQQECTNRVEEAAGDGDIEDIDANVCVQMPLFASAEAAQEWLAAHPGGRVLPIREMWDLSTIRDWRDQMSALLNLDRSRDGRGDEPHTIDPQSPERGDRMSNIKIDTDTSLADFIASWRRITTDDDDIAEMTRAGYALIGLTNFGEQPVQSARVADVLGWPVRKVEALARRGGFGTRVEDGLITVNPESAPSAPRRNLQIGDRRFGVTGCAPDVFLYAPLVRPSLQLVETCPATGTPIRIAFTPSGVESVEPSSAVVVMPHPRELDQPESGFDLEECRTDLDGNLCSQCPFYCSAEAAQGWLAAHPGGRVFPVWEAWDLSFLRGWREKMSALLDLDNLQGGRPRPPAN